MRSAAPYVHMLYRYHFVLGNAEAFPQQVYRYNNIFCDLIDNNSQRRTYIQYHTNIQQWGKAFFSELLKNVY